MDGEPSGRIKCILAKSTGVAYKMLRTSLDLCREYDDLKQSDVLVIRMKLIGVFILTFFARMC
jgi:hypothetical protein